MGKQAKELDGELSADETKENSEIALSAIEMKIDYLPAYVEDGLRRMAEDSEIRGLEIIRQPEQLKQIVKFITEEENVRKVIDKIDTFLSSPPQ